MSKFTDHLWSDLVREHGPSLANADRPARSRARRPRPRLLAGSTLGVASVGAALVLVLSGSAAPPAFAITRDSDGVLVKLNYMQHQDLPQVNQKLAAMGTNEQITIYMASGAAPVNGPVTCQPVSGASGPQVKVLVGTDGTEVIGSGQSAGNTAAGTFHLDHCTVAPADDTGPGTGNTGNTGNG